MNSTQAAEEFLSQYGHDYIDLLETIRALCQGMKKATHRSDIDDVYSRGSDPANEGEFKSAAKIASKVFLRAGETHAQAFLQLSDIVGLTVVVRYPDQVEGVVSGIHDALKTRHIQLLEVQTHEAKNGYYATHLICQGRRAGELLKCEIQVKTMLHNAWSAKMHDLTYKPSGALDPRMEQLMTSIADTIESLEIQSGLIRDLITANWDVEQETRRAARNAVFESMLDYSDKVWGSKTPQAFRDLGLEVANATWVDTVSKDDPRLVKLMDRIDAYCSDPSALRFGWMLAGRLASQRVNTDLARFFAKHAQVWLTRAPALLRANEIEAVEVRAVPLVFYVIGDLDAAIAQSDRIADDPNFPLSKADRHIIDLNRANFLIEREYHQPTRHDASRRQLREDILAIIDDPALNEGADPNMRSCIMDTKGLFEITFGETSKDARRGLELCIRSTALAEDDKVVTDAYLDLNMRLGWRRYFDLELRERMRLNSRATSARPQKGRPGSTKQRTTKDGATK